MTIIRPMGLPLYFLKVGMLYPDSMYRWEKNVKSFSDRFSQKYTNGIQKEAKTGVFLRDFLQKLWYHVL